MTRGGSASGGGYMGYGAGRPPGSACSGVGQTPPPRDTWDSMEYGQQAGGTHPAGMLSCSLILHCSSMNRLYND